MKSKYFVQVSPINFMSIVSIVFIHGAAECSAKTTIGDEVGQIQLKPFTAMTSIRSIS